MKLERRGQIENFPVVAYKAYYPKNWRDDTVFETFRRQEPFPVQFGTNSRLKLDEGESDTGLDIAGFFTDKEEVAKRFKFSSEVILGEFRLKLGKSFTINAEGEKAAFLQWGPKGRAFRDAVRSGKYDSVVIENTEDEGTIYVMLNSNFIKAIDASNFDELSANFRR